MNSTTTATTKKTFDGRWRKTKRQDSPLADSEILCPCHYHQQQQSTTTTTTTTTTASTKSAMIRSAKSVKRGCRRRHDKQLAQQTADIHLPKDYYRSTTSIMSAASLFWWLLLLLFAIVEPCECNPAPSSKIPMEPMVNASVCNDNHNHNREQQQQQRPSFSSSLDRRRQLKPPPLPSETKPQSNTTTAASEAAASTTKASTSTSTSANTCGVYLAPSTIPGAGNGLFAGRAFGKHDVVTDADITVTITDFAFHNNNNHNNKKDGSDEEDDGPVPFLWDEYTWEVDSYYGMEQEAVETYGASFGVGAVLNCVVDLVNVEPDYMGILDRAGLHRSKDPGAGAFTPYADRRGVAQTDIPAGMELFADYGAGYYRDRENPYGILNETERHQALKLLKGFKMLRDWFSHRAQKYNQQQQHLKGEGLAQDLFQLVHNIKQTWMSPVLRALPHDIDSVNEVAEHGIENAHYNRSIRSVEWLQENGSCADNLRAGRSSIPQAGRGAFARRPIAEGDTIAAMPLIHLANRSVLDMYLPARGDEAPFDRDSQRNATHGPHHQQLLLNYCFGREDLELLLCPYGNYNGLVNHAPSPQKVNSKLVWSSKHMTHPEWLAMSPLEWSSLYTVGLAFDLVATRDLLEGEEVFLDYGANWKLAWKTHVKKFRPPPNSEQYMAEYDWDDHFAVVESNPDHEIQVPVLGEKRHAAHTTVQDIACRNIFRELWGLGVVNGDGFTYHPCRISNRYMLTDKDGMSRQVYNVEIVNRHGDLEDEYEEEEFTSYSAAEESEWEGEYDSEYQYYEEDEEEQEEEEEEEEAYEEDEEEEDEGELPNQCEEELSEVLLGVPGAIFQFFDEPYSRDHAQPWAFRFPMHIPDDLIPEAWKKSS